MQINDTWNSQLAVVGVFLCVSCVCALCILTVYEYSAAPAHACPRAHRPAAPAPRQSSGVSHKESQTPHITNQRLVRGHAWGVCEISEFRDRHTSTTVVAECLGVPASGMLRCAVVVVESESVYIYDTPG